MTGAKAVERKTRQEILKKFFCGWLRVNSDGFAVIRFRIALIGASRRLLQKRGVEVVCRSLPRPRLPPLSEPIRSNRKHGAPP